jgi:3-hydroxyacyl-CoA dehydrogenase
MHLVSEDVISVADIDAAVSYGPGLRWGVMGPMMLYHLGGGAGGIDHWFDQFTGPITAWWGVLGNPQITPELRSKVTAGVMAEVAGRSIETLSTQRDRELMGLLKVRAAG